MSCGDVLATSFVPARMSEANSGIPHIAIARP